MLLEADLSRRPRLGALLFVCALLYASPALLRAQGTGTYGYGTTAATGYGNTAGFNTPQAQAQAGAPTDMYSGGLSITAGTPVFFDLPTANSKMPNPPHAQPELTGFRKGLLAACYYIPNRIMDLTDIFRFHLALGDGQGLSLRATKYLTASYYEDDTYCLGWTKRTPPWFGEQINERYLGFFAAQEGKLERDPTEVGFSFHLLIFGVNAAVSLGEAADAAAGLVGIDLEGDDHGPVMVDQAPPTPSPTQLELQRAVYGYQGPGAGPAAPQSVPQPGPTDPASAPAPANPPTTGVSAPPEGAGTTGTTVVPPPPAPANPPAGTPAPPEGAGSSATLAVPPPPALPPEPGANP